MLDETTAREWIGRLQRLWSERIPLAGAMQVEIRSLDERGLGLVAPLAPNRNHVGTAFGGSLQGLATLAGWGATLVTAGPRPGVGVVVAEARTRFIAPVTGEIAALAAWPPEEVAAAFRDELATHGRARLQVEVVLSGPGAPVAAQFSGRFVARQSAPA